jgi:hypothetical protein
MHLDELTTLKVKVQTLETENMTVKSIYTSTNITSKVLDKYVGQRPYNKSGLGYKKPSITFMCPKNREKQI